MTPHRRRDGDLPELGLRDKGSFLILRTMEGEGGFCYGDHGFLRRTALVEHAGVLAEVAGYDAECMRCWLGSGAKKAFELVPESAVCSSCQG